jgi:hypothetical protein
VLARFLQARSIDVVLDEFTFRSGQNLSEEIIHSIYTSDKFVLIASPRTFNSKYVQAELGYARHRSIELRPKPFIHVVSLSKRQSVAFLPKDLQGCLCHLAAGKTTLTLLYEVFFGIAAKPFGKLLAKQLRLSPNSSWIMVERRQVVDIKQLSGHSIFEAQRALQNISTVPLRHSHKMHVWMFGKTPRTRPNFRAFLDSGKRLKVSKVFHYRRGMPTYSAYVNFPDPIKPGEVIAFRIVFDYPKAFSLLSGDKYTLACEEFGYGYLSVDILFPRNCLARKPRIKISRPGLLKYLGVMTDIGNNRFTYRTFLASPGATYDFFLKCNELR